MLTDSNVGREAVIMSGTLFWSVNITAGTDPSQNQII